MTYELTSIKSIRKNLGMTQTELAKEAGVSQSLIAKIEAGTLDPTYSNAVKIFDTIDRLGKRQELCAHDIMQRNIITVKPGTSVVEAVKTMNKHAVSQVPVTDSQKIVGLITEKEVLETIGKEDIHKLTVKDIMSEPPPIVSEDTKLTVLKSLIQHYPLLIVAKKGEMAGILTKSDIISKLV